MHKNQINFFSVPDSIKIPWNSQKAEESPIVTTLKWGTVVDEMIFARSEKDIVACSTTVWLGIGGQDLAMHVFQPIELDSWAYQLGFVFDCNNHFYWKWKVSGSEIEEKSQLPLSETKAEHDTTKLQQTPADRDTTKLKVEDDSTNNSGQKNFYLLELSVGATSVTYDKGKEFIIPALRVRINLTKYLALDIAGLSSPTVDIGNKYVYSTAFNAQVSWQLINWKRLSLRINTGAVYADEEIGNSPSDWSAWGATAGPGIDLNLGKGIKISGSAQYTGTIDAKEKKYNGVFGLITLSKSFWKLGK